MREAIVFRAREHTSRFFLSRSPEGGGGGSGNETRRDATRRDATRRGVRSRKEEARIPSRRGETVAADKHVTSARKEIVRRASIEIPSCRSYQISPRARHEDGLVDEEILEAP